MDRSELKTFKNEISNIWYPIDRDIYAQACYFVDPHLTNLEDLDIYDLRSLFLSVTEEDMTLAEKAEAVRNGRTNNNVEADLSELLRRNIRHLAISASSRYKRSKDKFGLSPTDSFELAVGGFLHFYNRAINGDLTYVDSDEIVRSWEAQYLTDYVKYNNDDEEAEAEGLLTTTRETYTNRRLSEYREQIYQELREAVYTVLITFKNKSHETERNARIYLDHCLPEKREEKTSQTELGIKYDLTRSRISKIIIKQESRLRRGLYGKPEQRKLIRLLISELNKVEERLEEDESKGAIQHFPVI